MANFPLPKGYQRMGAFPLDSTSIFTTFAELEAYVLTGVAYPGQVCSVIDGGTYQITSTNTLVELGAGIDYGVF